MDFGGREPSLDIADEMLAEAVVAFQQDYDFDFVKVTPASSYCVRDWGVADVWQGSTEGTRSYVRRRVIRPEDWMGLESLDPLSGSLGEYLRCLQAVIQTQKESAPVLATVFSPLAQAKNLAGPDLLRDHLRANSDEIMAGLDRIASSTVRFVEEARRIGIDGIFYAIQHASTAFFDATGYARFGLGFDRMILEAAGGMWLNVVHLHGDRLLFDLAREFAAPVVHWHDREAGPDLAEGRRQSGKAVCGGLSRESTILLGDPVRVRAEAEEAIDQMGGGRGLILGTGCVVPIHAPRANLLAARRAVEARREL
jgi:uroporphyrinogen decarboxylase